MKQFKKYVLAFIILFLALSNVQAANFTPGEDCSGENYQFVGYNRFYWFVHDLNAVNTGIPTDTLALLTFSKNFTTVYNDGLTGPVIGSIVHFEGIATTKFVCDVTRIEFSKAK